MSFDTNKWILTLLPVSVAALWFLFTWQIDTLDSVVTARLEVLRLEAQRYTDSRRNAISEVRELALAASSTADQIRAQFLDVSKQLVERTGATAELNLALAQMNNRMSRLDGDNDTARNALREQVRRMSRRLDQLEKNGQAPQP